MIGRSVLRWLGRNVYPAFVPDGACAGAERFLEDVWRDAPRRVAFAHTAMAALTCLLPMAMLRTLRPLPFLPAAERERFVARALAAKRYAVRVMAYAMRGNAFVAVLRDPTARARMLGDASALRSRHDPVPLAARPSRGDRTPHSASVRVPTTRRGEVADFVIVGSGAAGATAALALGERGADVMVVEEGGWHRTGDFTEDLYGAMATLFRDFGAQVARGRSLFPVMEGACVGGTTVMNGAIVHRLPKEIHDEWCRDSGIAAALPFASLEDHAAWIEEHLGIGANLGPLLRGLPIAQTLSRLGWAHQAMRRNAPDCRATGRCLQGCPSGGKLSMEASFIPRAIGHGVRVLDRHAVTRVLHERGRATGVEVQRPDGSRGTIAARTAVVLAAGAIRSPLLLRRSGLGTVHVGRHFQCHLGVGALALMPKPVREIEGPPQGIEVFEFDDRGIKLATQLLPPELLLARTPVTGTALRDLFSAWPRISSWTVSVRARAEGTVRGGLAGPAIRFTPSTDDVVALREGVRRLGQLFFAAGAERVFPNVAGVPASLASARDVDLLLTASLDPRAYTIAVGHLFGTCRMGSDPGASVVAPDFRVHGAERLSVIDASVFPTNLGVNPQLAVMTLARHAALSVLARAA